MDLDELPSGNLLQFATENGPFMIDLPNLKIVIFQFENC